MSWGSTRSARSLACGSSCRSSSSSRWA
uniref:Uncharacterized protein n=1 Tax=Arundo donax TaxID=35708 RepID=A0A0A9AAK9_ARUDO